MKKVLIMFLGFVCLYNSIQSQTYRKFPESNFVWNYWLDYYDGGPCSNTSFIKLHFGNDTIINSQSYHSLFRSTTIYTYPSCTIPTPPFTYGPVFCDFIRQDTIQRKVYRLDTILQVDTLLIDFNLIVGQVHPQTSLTFGGDIYVSSIDSVFLGDNLFHKKYNFKYVDSLMQCPDDTVPIEFVSLIEGVGYTRGFSYGSGYGDIQDMAWLTGPDCDGMWARPGRLTCFGTYSALYGNVSEILDNASHKDSVYYDSTSAMCNLTLAIEDFALSDLISLYPNPTCDYISLNILENQAGIIPYSISNIHGQKVIQSRLIGTNRRIELFDLAPGIYFLYLDNTKTVIKFIKQ